MSLEFMRSVVPGTDDAGPNGSVAEARLIGYSAEKLNNDVKSR